MAAGTKKAYNKGYYERTKLRRKVEVAVGVILAGGRPQAKTMADLGLHEDMMSALRRKDRRAYGKMEIEHGLAEDSLYDKFKDAEVLPSKRPETRAAFQAKDIRQPPTVKAYDQGLEVTPVDGNGSVTWIQIRRFWQADRIQQYKLGTFQALWRDAEQKEPVLYTESTKKGKRDFFNMLREMYGQDDGADAMLVLREADDVAKRLRERYTKTEQKQLADATVASGSKHAVAGADDGEEVSSGKQRKPEGSGMVRSAHGESRRVRTTAPEMKTVTATYAKSLGHIVATAQAWKAFRNALGVRALAAYQGTFRTALGPSGHRAAAAAAKEAQRNKTKSDYYAVPSVKLLHKALKEMEGRGQSGTFEYLTAYLHIKLLGLRDNLGGIEMRSDDGHYYKDGEPDRMRKCWYNTTTGRLYIAVFKTAGSMAGQPYDFKLPMEIRATIKAVHDKNKNTPWLVGVGVTKEDGRPKSARELLKRAFEKIGFRYMKMGAKSLVSGVPTALDIRHAQVTSEHRRLEKDHPEWTADRIAQEIAGSFQHSADVNVDYLRKTFDSLKDKLATKEHLKGEKAPSGGVDTYDRGMPDEAMGPVSGEGSGDSGEGGSSGPTVPRRRRTDRKRRPRFAPVTPTPPPPRHPPPTARRSSRLAGKRSR